MSKEKFVIVVDILSATWYRDTFEVIASSKEEAADIILKDEIEPQSSQEIGEGHELFPCENDNQSTKEFRLSSCHNQPFKTNALDQDKHIHAIIRTMDFNKLEKQKKLLVNLSDAKLYEELKPLVNLLDSIQEYAVDSLELDRSKVYPES